MTVPNSEDIGPASAKIGQSFNDFLKEQGTYEETNALAVKRVIAFQLAQRMAELNISKTAMAQKLSTSRAQVDRLLDPDNDGVTINSLAKAAKALGGSLNIELR